MRGGGGEGGGEEGVAKPGGGRGGGGGVRGDTHTYVRNAHVNTHTHTVPFA